MSALTKPSGISGTPVDPASPGGPLISPEGGELVPSTGLDVVYKGDGAGGWVQGASPASPPTAHDLAGAGHNADTLANLNAKVSDATLVDTGDPRFSDVRTPASHGLGGAEHATATLAQLNAKVSDATLIDTGDGRLSDARTPTSHGLGGTEHAAATLAQLNAKVSDGTLVDVTAGLAASRPAAATAGRYYFSTDTGNWSRDNGATWDNVSAAASAHLLGGSSHTADTLANLNAKVSDATLIDTGDARLSDARTPTSHGLGGTEHATATLAQLNAKVSDATLIGTTDARLSDARSPKYDTAAAFPEVTTTSASYVLAARVLFGGSTNLGTPANVKIVGGFIGTGTGSYRVLDVTNALTICEVTGSAAVNPAIINLGTLSNIPTGEAIWELQLLRATGTGGNVPAVSAISLLF